MAGKKKWRLGIAAFALLGAVLCPLATQAQTAQLPAPLFAGDDEIELTLTMPLRTLVAQRKRRPELAGTLTYTEPTGSSATLDVEVTTRGFNRLEMCAFPPLSLNFKRGQVEGTLFAEQNRLKLVTKCRDVSSFEQYLYLEYVVYRIYALVSDFAFRARPARMRYVNTERDNQVEEAPAFFIEHADGLARRVGMAAVDLPSVAPAELDARALATLSLFQYMIGNTDWSVTTPADGEDCCHNTAVLAPLAGDTGIVAVPYDFDQSGLISTSYATPSERLRLRSVRERLFRGFCVANEYLDESIDRFNTARPAIETLLDTERLSEKTREDVLRYVAEFYQIVNDPNERQREIVDACRG